MESGFCLCLRFRCQNMGNSATIWLKSSSVTAMKWFIGTLRVKNGTKEHAPMPGSIALLKLASQVIGVEQADSPANFSL
jgi:hypothetical protein